MRRWPRRLRVAFQLRPQLHRRREPHADSVRPRNRERGPAGVGGIHVRRRLDRFRHDTVLPPLHREVWSAKLAASTYDAEKRDWLKLHALIGTKTNVHRRRERHRSQRVQTRLSSRRWYRSAPGAFNIQTVAADKAYGAPANVAIVAEPRRESVHRAPVATSQTLPHELSASGAKTPPRGAGSATATTCIATRFLSATTLAPTPNPRSQP